MTRAGVRNLGLPGMENDMQEHILEIVECPECAAPAEIVERFVLESTNGPVEHAILLCILRHRFTELVERLMSPRPPSPDRSAASGRRLGE